MEPLTTHSPALLVKRGDLGKVGPRGPIVKTVTQRHRTVAMVLDWGERLVLMGLYVWLLDRMVSSYRFDRNLVDFALLPSVTMLIFFTLTRHTTTHVTRRPIDWTLAFAASVFPLLLTPAFGFALISPKLAVILIVSGWLIDIYAQYALGRSFGCVPANRGLKLGGPYRFVRHPMYTGYLLTHIGFVAMNASPLNVAILVACYASQIPRLLIEERLLADDPRYRNYMEAVPYRMIPGIF